MTPLTLMLAALALVGIPFVLGISLLANIHMWRDTKHRKTYFLCVGATILAALLFSLRDAFTELPVIWHSLQLTF